MVDLDTQLARYADELENEHYTPIQAKNQPTQPSRRLFRLAAAAVLLAGFGALGFWLLGRDSSGSIETVHSTTTTVDRGATSSSVTPFRPDFDVRTFNVEGAEMVEVLGLAIEIIE